MTSQTHFILNDREVTTSESPGVLVLDYLRRRERLVGTKEGCKEGDCGACVVLIGEWLGQEVRYKPVTSCLIPVGELQGKHLVTIEGLNREKLTPVQQAIVDEGGSQCGFCTPGIVVSLTGYLINAAPGLTADGIKYALGGNLCRCTGYASLLRAGQKLIDAFGNGSGNSKELSAAETIAELVEQSALPSYFTSIPGRLKKLPKPKPLNGKRKPAFIIAGGTDIYLQKGDLLPDAQVAVLNARPEWQGISVKNGQVHVGALTTFEAFAWHPDILNIIPNMPDYMQMNASWQIRNRATLGGNIVNASPIGDMTILLLALESTLVLEAGKKRRTVPLKSFYKGYKNLDKAPSEILTEIVFPVPEPETRIHFEKVSKRKTLDIAAVNSAIKIRAQNGIVADVQLTIGGVAPVPLFMYATCDYLEGSCIDKETILGAVSVAMTEISPISDIRGGAEYKRLLVRQLLIAHFTKLFPEFVTVRSLFSRPCSSQEKNHGKII
ncbi:MAG: FAD binding domain-containing protein [bacterium]